MFPARSPAWLALGAEILRILRDTGLSSVVGGPAACPVGPVHCECPLPTCPDCVCKAPGCPDPPAARECPPVPPPAPGDGNLWVLLWQLDPRLQAAFLAGLLTAVIIVWVARRLARACSRDEGDEEWESAAPARRGGGVVR